MTVHDVSRWQGVIDWDRAKVAVTEVVMRCGMGLTGVDEQFSRNWHETARVSIPRRGVYHYLITGVSAADHLSNIERQTHSDYGNLKFTVDVERTRTEREKMAQGWRFPKEQYTAMLHDLCYALKAKVAAGVRIYSTKWEIEAMTTQPAWLAEFDFWVAGYPTDPNNTHYQPLIPHPWTGYALWQYSNKGIVPGIDADVDLSRPNLASPPPQEIMMRPGTMYGIHAEQASQAVPLMKKYQEQGVQVTAILAMENPGLCVDAKAINPNILTIARWEHPNNKWERGHDVFNWSQAERLACAQSSIQLIFDRTNDTEYQASDYFAPVFNEPDPPELNGDGYKALAEVMILLCQEATRRSPEMEARGLHPIRLALCSFNRGTPEYNEMQAMVRTGLFELMRSRGDLLITHEGVGVDEPVDFGSGDLIPGAPFVPPYAGSLAGRINYLYSLGVQVPFVVTEWYDGMWRSSDPVRRLWAMKWYDRLMRHNPWFRGFCPFELTDIPNGPWSLWDFTPTFKTDEMLADMLQQKNIHNPIGDAMPNITDADFNALVIANQQVSAILNKYHVGHVWAVGDVVLANTNPLITYNAPTGIVHDRRSNPDGSMITYDLNVLEVSPDKLWLRVSSTLWVRGADVKLKGT